MCDLFKFVLYIEILEWFNFPRGYILIDVLGNLIYVFGQRKDYSNIFEAFVL